jgi:DNA excision repair protein ERCC-2
MTDSSATIPAAESTMRIERPWQRKAVWDILDLIKSGTKRIILNAPTGSGKTKIALDLIRSVYRESGLSSYVAVRTINEMSPYDHAVAKFQMGLIYKYMIGKRRGCPYYTEGDDANVPLCDACLGREIVVENRNQWGEEGIKQKVKITNEENARRVIRPEAVFKDIRNGLSFLEEKYVRDKKAQICLYHSLKQIPSDFVLLTYPYLLNKAIRSGTRLNFSKSLLIVDEAHNLENAAGFTYNISTREIEGSGKEFLSKCLPRIRDTFHDVEDLGIALSRLSDLVRRFSALPSSMPHFEQEEESLIMKGEDDDLSKEQERKHKGKLLDKHDFLSKFDSALKTDYEVICDAHEKIEEAKREFAREKRHEMLRNPFSSIISFFGTLAESYDDYELFSEGRGSLSIRLVDPAPPLQILKQPEILVMMSGTMPSTDYVEKVWGIEGCSEISVLKKYARDYYSVFSRENLEYRVDAQVTTGWSHRKSGGEMLWRRYAEIVNRAFDEESSLSMLVCCPSYFVAERISNYILPRKFVEDRQTPIEEVKRLILASGTRIVVVAVAHGKLLEGVELVEDGRSLIDCVVVAGIPYPVPDDIYKLRFAKVTKRLGIEDGTREIGRFERECFRHQPALMTVRQAIGRAVRYPDDRAKIILADSRFDSTEWRRDLLS